MTLGGSGAEAGARYSGDLGGLGGGGGGRKIEQVDRAVWAVPGGAEKAGCCWARLAGRWKYS